MDLTSSFLAGKIPWTEEPGKLQSMGSQKSDTTEHTSILARTLEDFPHKLKRKLSRVSFTSIGVVHLLLLIL